MKTSADYLARITATKAGYLDALWSEADGCYKDGSYHLTWLNAYMLQTVAILAGQGQASETDKARARAVAAKLVAAPAYTADNTWTHLLDGTSDAHSAVDAPVAESLFYAHKHRAALALDPGVAAAALAILTENRQIPPTKGIYSQLLSDGTRVGGYPLSMADVWDNQTLAKWGMNRMSYGFMLGAGNGSAISQAAKRFISQMDKPSPLPYVSHVTNQPWIPLLYGDFGWPYIDTSVWQSFEYGAMSQGSFQLYYPEIGSAMALTADEAARIKAWQRSVLGQWQRNGYANWDSCWSEDRVHILKYWVWSLRSLLGMVRGSALNQGAGDHLYAKWMLDGAIDFHEHIDAWQADAADDAAPRLPFGTTGTDDAFGHWYNFPKSSANAKFVMELATAVDLGIADAPSADPGNVWGWGWAQKHIHVSTPAYDAASLPWAPLIGVWGMDAVQLQHWGISRIAKPTGEILTALGGYGREAFSFLVSRGGVTDIDTGAPSSPQPAQTVWRDGVQQMRVAYDTQEIPSTFASNVRSLCSRSGTNYRVEVDTSFFPDRIRSTHRAVLTGSAGAAVALMSVPARKNVVIEYVAAGGAKTVVWNGSVLTPAGSPAPSACRYIHMKWAGFGAGLLIVPRTATVGAGAKVTALGSAPGGYPNRQPAQDRSLLIYLADTTTEDVGTVEIAHDYALTDGTDEGAATVYAALQDFEVALPAAGVLSLLGAQPHVETMPARSRFPAPQFDALEVWTGDRYVAGRFTTLT